MGREWSSERKVWERECHGGRNVEQGIMEGRTWNRDCPKGNDVEQGMSDMEQGMTWRGGQTAGNSME